MTFRPQVVKLPAPLRTCFPFAWCPRQFTPRPLLSSAQTPPFQASLIGLPDDYCLTLLPAFLLCFSCPTSYHLRVCVSVSPEAQPQEGGAFTGCWPLGLVQWVPVFSKARASDCGERAAGWGQARPPHAALLPPAHVSPHRRRQSRLTEC